MALQIRRFREISRLLPQLHQGNINKLLKRNINSLVSHLSSLRNFYPNISRSFDDRKSQSHRFSTASQRSHKPLLKVDLLSFIASTLDKNEGPCHCWLNKAEDLKDFQLKDKTSLILAGAFKSDVDSVILFEKVKALQQRYPTLQVMGFHSTNAISSETALDNLLQITMREYLTFPILLSNKDFPEVTDGVSYVISKGFRSPIITFDKDEDIGIIEKAIKSNLQEVKKSSKVNLFESTWMKTTEVIKEPYICSFFRNSLIYFPGCIAVDDYENRLFLSDTNHHRILVLSGNGKILDCIGSSPGFEDGEFESAKLLRPASSFYHEDEDSLYFADSENHAIRRADMRRKVVETLYPINNTTKENNFSLLSWIVDKFWTKPDIETKSTDLDSESFLFPWHLIQSSDNNNNLFIFNRSFETLWIMDSTSGAIKEVVKGFPKILEVCEDSILEKISILKKIPAHLLPQHTDSSSHEFSNVSLASNVANLEDHIVFCDSVGQAVLKLDENSGTLSSFHLSNFGTLGLPYWLSHSLERVYSAGDVLPKIQVDHTQRFSLLPGRIDIKLNINLPKDTQLVEPLQEGCIWRQARGTATDVSALDIQEASSDKAGISQQWYDELDNLASLTEEIELETEEEKSDSDLKMEDGKIFIDCAVNTSPGTCEVIVYVALYLKLKRNPSSSEENRTKKAARIVEIMNPKNEVKFMKTQSIELLVKSNTDLDEFVMMRPLHVKLRIDCRNHPKAENTKDTILTDSSIHADITL